MKRYRITLDDRTFDIEVLDNPRQPQVRVRVNGEVFTVGVEAASAVAAPTPSLAPVSEVAAAGRTVIAPLPGAIKSIAVQPGQQVAANDELLVIEAMKMDNVIRARRGGTIGAIHVTEGRQVAYGEPLLDFADRREMSS